MADVAANSSAQVIHDPTAFARRSVLDGLPPHAQQRYRQYGQRKLEVEHQLRFVLERDKEMDAQLYVMRHNVAARRANGTLAVGEERALALLETEYQQHTRRRNQLNETRIGCEQIVNQLNIWLGAVAGGLYQGPHYDPRIEAPPTASLQDGETYTEAVRRVQAEVSGLRMRLMQVKAAPPPPHEIKAMTKARLDQLAASAPVGLHWTRDSLTGNRDELLLQAPDMFEGPGIGRGAATAWMYRLFPDLVLAAFTAHVDDDAQGIPRNDKPRMIAELEAEIVDLELQEMSYVEQGDLLPRPSMSALALLGLCPLRPQPEPLAIAAE